MLEQFIPVTSQPRRQLPWHDAPFKRMMPKTLSALEI